VPVRPEKPAKDGFDGNGNECEIAQAARDDRTMQATDEQRRSSQIGEHST